MRDYHNPWRETTCFAKPLDRAPHIIYTSWDIHNPLNPQTAAKRTNPQADTSKWEDKIDQLVYQLYGLTGEEIAIVEGKKQ